MKMHCTKENNLAWMIFCAGRIFLLLQWIFSNIKEGLFYALLQLKQKIPNVVLCIKMLKKMHRFMLSVNYIVFGLLYFVKVK